MASDHGDDGGQRPVDLDAYLARIGYRERLDPTVETLRGLHFAHATQIPFENLDILLGRSIVLDLESLQKKLVERRRGGYCFEQNTLFAAVLESLGFAVTRLAARVRFGATSIRPRSHMLLSVEIDGEPWLADVGFGGEGLLHPVPLDKANTIQQGHGASGSRAKAKFRCSSRTMPTAGLICTRSLASRSIRLTLSFRITSQQPIRIRRLFSRLWFSEPVSMPVGYYAIVSLQNSAGSAEDHGRAR